jgi:hypothetical protein
MYTTYVGFAGLTVVLDLGWDPDQLSKAQAGHQCLQARPWKCRSTAVLLRFQ